MRKRGTLIAGLNRGSEEPWRVQNARTLRRGEQGGGARESTAQRGWSVRRPLMAQARRDRREK